MTMLLHKASAVYNLIERKMHQKMKINKRFKLSTK